MSMALEPCERRLQQDGAVVLAKSEDHLIEHILFRSPKVTFGSVGHIAFEDALHMRAAMLEEKFRPWFEQETRDVVW